MIRFGALEPVGLREIPSIPWSSSSSICEESLQEPTSLDLESLHLDEKEALEQVEPIPEATVTENGMFKKLNDNVTNSMNGSDGESETLVQCIENLNIEPKLEVEPILEVQVKKSWAAMAKSAPVQPHNQNIIKILIRPRGLVNNGNMCFMNAILQPLVHCSVFYSQFLEYAQSDVLDHLPSRSLTQAMVEKRVDRIEYDPFAPEYVHDALRASRNIAKGRQEDAEEFLGYLLDGLHEEYLVFQKASHQPIDQDQSTDWLEVTKKRKVVHTRRTEVPESPVSKIFAGQIRSVVKASGIKDSVTVEPFSTFQLDITHPSIKSIEDALRQTTQPENLDGFLVNSIEVKASKQIAFDSLPLVLILHLKRFVFDTIGGTQKLPKFVSYPHVLTIPQQCLALNSKTLKPLTYSLFAVVFHRGKKASGGHYTCHVKRSSSEWLHIDDTEISSISAAQVRSESKSQAYMLFYSRNL